MQSSKLIIMPFILLVSINISAQSWNINGNDIPINQPDPILGITSPTNKNFVFINGNTAGAAVERGRITSAGLWGIGTKYPNSLVHINAAAGETGFRVQLNGSTKLGVFSNGGVYVGSPGVPPVNGLHVSGFLRSGNSNYQSDIPLHIPNGQPTSPTGGGFFMAGSLSSTTVIMGGGYMLAKNNGLPATLSFNATGGDVSINNNGIVIDATNNRIGMLTANPLSDLHLLHQSSGTEEGGMRLTTAFPNFEEWSFYTQNIDGNLMLTETETDFTKHYYTRGSFNDASGVYTSLSDARYKKNVESAGPVLNDVLRLSIRKYHFVNNDEADQKYYGLLAQEVEQIFPELVMLHKTDDGKEIYSMYYNGFGILAVKAIQERQKLIDEQNKRINELIILAKQLMGESAFRDASGQQD